MLSIPDPKIIDKLQNYNLQYELIQHEPFFTCEESSQFWKSRAGEDNSKQTSKAKSLLVRNKKKTQYYLIVVDCDFKIDMKQLETILDSSRLSFASPNDLNSLMQVYPGCVNPFSLIHDQNKQVLLFIQSHILEATHQAFHPGNNEFSVELPTQDFLKYFKEEGITINTIEF